MDQTGPPRRYRPVALTEVEMLRGSDAELSNARQGGGQIGCDSVTFSSARNLTAGGRYVLFFFDVAASTGSTSDVPSVLDALPISASNMVDTRLEGPMPLDRVVQLLKNNPHASPEASRQEGLDGPYLSGSSG